MSIKLADGATVLLRFGGWGDLFPVICVARWMKEKFPDRPIDFAARGNEQCEFLRGSGLFRSVYEQIEDMGNRWVEWDLGVDGLGPGFAPLHRLQDAYDQVLDFKDTVESNRFADHGNWYDLSLGFAGFDPAEVPPDFKRPYVKLGADVIEAGAKNVPDIPRDAKRVALALAGSAPLRSIPREFWQTVVDGMPDVTFLILSGPEKAGLAPAGPNVRSLIGKAKMLEAAAVLCSCDLAICADTGLAHFAEGLGVPNITIYTTVRGWTRSLYYKWTTTVDSPLDCQCAALGALCPRTAESIMAPLNGVEREIFQMRHIHPTPEPIIMERLQIPPAAFAKESEIVEMYRQRLHGEFAPCVNAVKPEVVVEKAVEILEGKDAQGRDTRSGSGGPPGDLAGTCPPVPEARAAV